MVANAASGTLYLDQATDPHGGIWLPGTTNGLTNGPMSTSTVAPPAGTLTWQALANTAPAGWAFGHLWETDVPSGFCRVDTIPDPNVAGAVKQVYARSNAYAAGPTNAAPPGGGCVHAGQKASQPMLDPRRNADGTFFVYTCDWAVFSAGCYRMTYDPGSQQMTAVNPLASGRFPTAGGRGIKPFSTAVGHDGNLYISSDLLPYIYRLTNPHGDLGLQQVQVVASSLSNTRVRAETLACWEPNRGGTTGLPTCAQAAAAGNLAPDLVITEKNGVTVIMDIANCAGVPALNDGTPSATPACLPKSTPIRTLTPMGAQTQGGWNQIVGADGLPTWGPALNPNLIYITDSPGATAQILRYTISTNVQDSYSNFGVLADGSVAQYSFAFSATQSPDGRMFLGDDPCAGAQAFCGHIYTIAAGAPADVLGQPGLPAVPPPPPSLVVGNIYGNGVTLPADGLWLPGPAGTPGHLWLADARAGFCRVDPPAAGAPAGTLAAYNTSTCVGPPAIAKPGQPAFDNSVNVVYLPDDKGGNKGDGAVALTYDQNGTICKNPTTGALLGPETLCNPVVFDGAGALAGQKARASAIDFTSPDHPLYVGFLNRNVTAPTEIARVNNPLCSTDTFSGASIILGTTGAPSTSCGTAAAPVVASVDFVANAARHKPIFNINFIGADLYNGNNGGLDFLPNPKTCQPGGCTSVQILNVRGPRGMATDGTNIFMAGPAIPVGCPPTCPAPGSITTPVNVYNTTTGVLSTFSTQALLADGVTLQAYEIVNSLTVDPAGNVFVADDPSVLGLPAGQGHIYKIVNAPQEPMPSIVSKPTNPTNNNNTPTAAVNPHPAPSFAFQSADTAATFQCSFVAVPPPPAAIVDKWTGCGGTGNGVATYGADATGVPVLNGAGALADGPYVFRVRGNGANGVSAPNSYLVTIDTVAPIITLAPVKAITNVNTPAFSWTVDKLGTTFTCALNLTGAGSSPSQCGTTAFSINYPAQPDGAYTFTLSGTDRAGNVTTVTATQAIDTVAPSVSASPAGGAFTAAQSVVLTATDPAPSAGGSTIFYTTDGTTPTTASTSGPSPVTVSVPNSLTLKYFAVDAAGNASAVASQVYQIGSVSITQNPPAITNVNTPTFAFTDVLAGATFQCSLVLQTGLDTFAPCTSPITYPAQPDGAYRFVVKDQNGTSASFLFTIDTTPPAVTLTQNPPNPDPSSSATFGFTATDATGVAGFQCWFGTQGAAPVFSACTSPQSFANLTNGLYDFQVKATDVAGNTSAATTYPFSVQATAGPKITTPPTQTLTGLTTAQVGTSATTSSAGPITASTTGVPVTISWAGTACASGVTNCNVDHYVLQQSVNGGGFTSVPLPSPTATSVTLNLKPSPTNQPSAATTYAFQVQAVDVTGAVSPFSIAPGFQVPDTDNSFNTSFNGSWSGVNISSAFGGSVSESTTAGSTANPSNAQQATSFALVSTLGPDRGKAQIKIDGQLVATVDLYSATQQTAQVVWSINGLNGVSTHQIQVVSTGTKNAAASAAKVDYDAILALK